MTHLDLFSGIGGFTIAAQWAGFQTIGFSEIEPFCCKLLSEKWPEVPDYGDIRTADFSGLRGRVDVLSAGVPCQPSSLAGKRRGSKDDRWLWPAVLDVVGRVQPAWCIFENPPGILSLDEFSGVLLRLGSLGYAVRAFSVPANAVGAKHRRQRVFIVANADKLNGNGAGSGSGGISQFKTSEIFGNEILDAEALADAGCRQFQLRRESGDLLGSSQETGARGQVPRDGNESGDSGQTLADATGTVGRKEQDGQPDQPGFEASQRDDVERCDPVVADADRVRLEEHESRESGQCAAIIGSGGPYGFRLTESPLCGATPRIPDRSHRLKALGNAVVPQQAWPFFEAIAQVERQIA